MRRLLTKESLSHLRVNINEMNWFLTFLYLKFEITVAERCFVKREFQEFCSEGQFDLLQNIG